MNTYDGLYSGAAAVERYRHRNLLSRDRQTAARVVIAQRELATVTHIPGDDALEEIDRKFYAALRWFRWRNRESRSA